ncbi:MAG: ABC transporter substrate-binding protein, partial [Deltaproteobacteria bacterium]
WPLLAGEHTTLTFLTWKPGIPGVWERLIRRFEAENQDIRVQRQVGPQSSTQFHAIVSQRLKNRDPSVDVFFMDVIWSPEFASAGWVLDLSPWFPATERKRFLTGPIAANTYRAGIYAIPSFLDAGLLYYRTDLLKKYGYDPPRTWNFMLSQGKKIIEGEQDPTLHIYSAQFKQYEGLVCNMMEFIWSNGGAVLEHSTGKVRLTRPPALEAVAFVRDRIIGKAAPRGVLSYEEPESLALFIQGKAIFHRNWPYAWTVANDPDRSKVAGKVGVVSLPAFQGHSPAPALGGWQFGINRWSRHPDAARRFVQFMTSYQAQKTLALEAGRAPTRRAIYQDPEVRFRAPHFVSFLPAFEKARPRPLTPLYPYISQELQRFFSRAISDPTSNIYSLAREVAVRIEGINRLGTAIQP